MSGMLLDTNVLSELMRSKPAAESRGHSISTEDGQITATALSNDLSLATRNAKDFKGIEGLTVINPWV